MSEATARKIASAVSILVIIFVMKPAINALADLHNNMTGAVVYLTLIIVGFIVAWVSVTAPAYAPPTKAETVKARAEAKVAEEKGDKTTVLLGWMVLALAAFFFVINPGFIFGSAFYALMWFLMIGGAIAMIISGKPTKNK